MTAISTHLLLFDNIRHGLRTSNEAFFSLKSRTFGSGQINSEAFGVFLAKLPVTSTHFGTVSPFSMFSIIQPLFPQKTKPLYPNIYLGLEFEFLLQRIRDLAFACP